MKVISTHVLVALFSISLLLFAPILKAQDWDMFDKVEGGTTAESIKNKFVNVQKLSYYADTLPSWFFSVPQVETAYYAIGISDPDMLPEDAKELAIHRAKTMAVLLSNCKIQYIRDIYSSVSDYNRYVDVRGRFDTYFKISGSNQVTDNMFAVVDTHFTKYNEYMVLLKYQPSIGFDYDSDLNMPTSYINVAGSSFIVEASVDGAFETQAEYEVLSYNKGNKTQKGNFVYLEKANRFLSSSYFNDVQVDFPQYPYIYASPAWTKTRSAFSCYSGLWSMYMRQFMNYLSLTCENSSVKMKNTDQRYGDEIVYLSREIASFSAELRINGINFDSDTMKFEIDIVRQQKLIK